METHLMEVSDKRLVLLIHSLLSTHTVQPRRVEVNTSWRKFDGLVVELCSGVDGIRATVVDHEGALHSFYPLRYNCGVEAHESKG